MIHDAAYYAAIHEGLFNALEALDVTGYAGTDSDGWIQGRFLDATREGYGHLEAWLDLGSAEFRANNIVHRAQLVFVSRHNAADDSLSLGRAHAAARDAAEVIQAPGTWPNPIRALEVAYDIEVPNGEWLLVTVAFQLHLPRRAR
jgi:hypothetical protein